MNAVRLWAIGIVAIVTAVAAYAWRAVDQAKHPVDFATAFAPSAVASEPAAWNGTAKSTCPLTAQPGPAICVAAPAGRAYRRGEAIATRISWRGVPANSSFVVYLVHDQPDGTVGIVRYLGTTGALTLDAIPVTGDGAVDFTWNGNQFACAPGDAPMLCKDTANIGRYRIAVALYARDRVTVVGWPDPNPPAVLAVSTTAPFIVRGTPDLADTARSLWWAAMDQAMAQHEITTSATLGDMTGRNVETYRRGDRICAQIDAAPPYRSTLEACAPVAKLIGDAGLLSIQKPDISVTGHVTVIPGTLSRERAVAAAKDAAAKPYLARVAFRHQPTMEQAGYTPGSGGVSTDLDDFQAWDKAHPAATTYLGDGPRETVYRADLGGGWVVVMDEIMAGGTLPDDERFADKVLVYVRADAKACVIETRKYKGDDFSRDPKTAKFACP